MNTNNHQFTLSDGHTIPGVGFGTWQSPNGETTVQAVITALEAGYRHIDTAAAYNNEKSVGTAIADSGFSRNEIFVTTKLWNADRGFDNTFKAFDKSLAKLKLDYVDLYLIHWPANERKFKNWKEINADTWQAMERLQREGRIRSIGVSNFAVNHLEALYESAEIKPAVNQIEFHPGQLQEDIVTWCRENNILVEGWSPLGTGLMLENETLKGIASGYQVSVAQLCIRWALQHGILPLPKSVTPSRIRENFDVFNFEISAEDISAIDALPYIGGSGLDPNTVTF